jgi:asparaginyl-tRNA synthetase
VSYSEAIERLKAKGAAISWGDDFGGDEETLLASEFDRPVFVHRYPAAAKAFYMEPDPDDPRLALAVDCLAPEGYGEIAGGGSRIHDLALLDRRLAEHQLPREAFEWYRDLRRYGSVPHSGFGLGLERLVAWVCRLPHVRETIPFPRMLYRIYP